MELSAGEHGVSESFVWTNQQLTSLVATVYLRQYLLTLIRCCFTGCDDINTVITAKGKSKSATLTDAKKKEYAQNQKRTQAEGKRVHREIVPKLTEEFKRLTNKNTELERTVVLLTQPALRHSSKNVHGEMQFWKAHNTQLQAEKAEEKRQKQQAIYSKCRGKS